MLEIKSTVTEMEETLMGFINRPSTAEERISELEDISETSKAEKQTETSLRKDRISKDYGTIQKV